MDKFDVRVKGISPPPSGWQQENLCLVCAICSFSFQVSREAGVLVKRLELRGREAALLTLCETCGPAVAGVELLVFADAGTSEADLREAIKVAVALRQGFVKNFGVQ